MLVIEDGISWGQPPSDEDGFLENVHSPRESNKILWQ